MCIRDRHSLGDAGLLDLQGKDVGPAKLKELAAFFSSPESAAVRHLVLSGNMITDRGKDLSGLKALCEVLLTLNHPVSLDLANCGLGVAEVTEVAKAIGAGAVAGRAAAAVAKVSLAGNFITGTLPSFHFDRKFDSDLSGLIEFGKAMVLSLIHI